MKQANNHRPIGCPMSGLRLTTKFSNSGYRGFRRGVDLALDQSETRGAFEEEHGV